MARGEKITRSVSRSRWNLSWAPSRPSRISSSLILSDAFEGIFERVLDGGDLLLPEAAEVFGFGRVMAVTIDDHGTFTAA